MRFVVKRLLQLCVFCLIPMQALAGTLTLYFYPAPVFPDWKSPKTIFVSAAENEVLSRLKPGSHSLGHANLLLECGDEVLGAGMTSGEDYHPLALLRKGAGLGVLFQNFEGRFEEYDDVLRQVIRGGESGKMTFVRFRISDGTCRRLMDYTSQYKARGEFKHYGLPNRPRFGEGSGCSAFVISYLELAGILTHEMRGAWSLHVRVPRALVGGALNQKKISLRKLYFSKPARAWADGTQSGIDLFFWEPNYMYRWVKDLWDSRAPDAGEFTRTQLGRAKGIEADVSDIPTPQDPIWKLTDTGVSKY